jgi:cystathionine beta-lyase/cystathionine gamma-synthase
MKRPRQLSTLCAHAGGPRATAVPPSHVPPLYQQSVFDFPTIEASLGPLAGEGYVYRRIASPNADDLAATVAALEGAEDGIAAGSGMAAIAAALFSILEAGDAVVVQADVYGGTRALLDGELARLGIEARTVDPADAAGLERALAGARVAVFETLSNPLLRELDSAAVLGACRRYGVVSVIDNTFATPLRQRPLEDGADLVVHSVTKFLGGHHDLGAGVLVGGAERIAAARAALIRIGLQAAPLDCWLAVRGIRTLEVRMQRAWATAAKVAGFLRGHPGIAAVHSADRCALVSFDAGDYDRASALIAGLSLITLSPSLGGVVTTASHAATSSHRNLSPEERRAGGIGDGLIRLSIGLEDAGDVIGDLEGALG